MNYDLDLIVFIKCSGPNVREDNLSDTIISFADKNKNVNYKYFIYCDPNVRGWISNIINTSDLITEDMFLDIVVSENSWAQDYNHFFERYQDKAKWILISHDDVEFVTDNYFERIVNSISGYEDQIGWITSTSNYYLDAEGRAVTDIFRPGFHHDYDDWPCMFYLHDMKNVSRLMINSDSPLLDYPKGPVKIHGPMSAIMLATTKSLKKIGYCEDFTKYTMLIDEDWSLEALKNKLWNVWVPDVFHKHPLRRHLRPTNNKWEVEAHENFTKKWGFTTGVMQGGKQVPISIPIEQLREMYKDTYIPWSTYRKSYDWEYLHDE